MPYHFVRLDSPPGPRSFPEGPRRSRWQGRLLQCRISPFCASRLKTKENQTKFHSTNPIWSHGKEFGSTYVWDCFGFWGLPSWMMLHTKHQFGLRWFVQIAFWKPCEFRKARSWCFPGLRTSHLLFPLLPARSSAGRVSENRL